MLGDGGRPLYAQSDDYLLYHYKVGAPSTGNRPSSTTPPPCAVHWPHQLNQCIGLNLVHCRTCWAGDQRPGPRPGGGSSAGVTGNSLRAHLAPPPRGRSTPAPRPTRTSGEAPALRRVAPPPLGRGAARATRAGRTRPAGSRSSSCQPPVTPRSCPQGPRPQRALQTHSFARRAPRHTRDGVADSGCRAGRLTDSLNRRPACTYAVPQPPQPTAPPPTHPTTGRSALLATAASAPRGAASGRCRTDPPRAPAPSGASRAPTATAACTPTTCSSERRAPGHAADASPCSAAVQHAHRCSAGPH